MIHCNTKRYTGLHTDTHSLFDRWRDARGGMEEGEGVSGLDPTGTFGKETSSILSNSCVQ